MHGNTERNWSFKLLLARSFDRREMGKTRMWSDWFHSWHAAPIILRIQHCHFCTLICHSAFVLSAFAFKSNCSLSLTSIQCMNYYVFATEYMLLVRSKSCSIFSLRDFKLIPQRLHTLPY